MWHPRHSLATTLYVYTAETFTETTMLLRTLAIPIPQYTDSSEYQQIKQWRTESKQVCPPHEMKGHRVEVEDSQHIKPIWASNITCNTERIVWCHQDCLWLAEFLQNACVSMVKLARGSTVALIAATHISVRLGLCTTAQSFEVMHCNLCTETETVLYKEYKGCTTLCGKSSSKS